MKFRATATATAHAGNPRGCLGFRYPIILSSRLTCNVRRFYAFFLAVGFAAGFLAGFAFDLAFDFAVDFVFDSGAAFLSDGGT